MEICLPTIGSVRFVNHEGTLLFEDALFEVDRLLYESQQDPKISSDLTKYEWVPGFIKAIAAKHGCTLTFDQAVLLANRVVEETTSLKKKSTSGSTSLTGSPASTPSTSAKNT